MSRGYHGGKKQDWKRPQKNSRHSTGPAFLLVQDLFSSLFFVFWTILAQLRRRAARSPNCQGEGSRVWFKPRQCLGTGHAKTTQAAWEMGTSHETAWVMCYTPDAHRDGSDSIWYLQHLLLGVALAPNKTPQSKLYNGHKTFRSRWSKQTESGPCAFSFPNQNGKFQDPSQRV